MKTIITVVGARPQFVKASAVSRAFSKRPEFRELLLHTGQHYDAGLSDVFFDELSIPRPTFQLGIGSGPHGAQTGAMLKAIEEVLVAEKPQGVMVYGDTNSTLAGALAAAKLHIPVVHVEAGLRSFNRRMPEEINRVLTDHLSQFLFCPTLASVEHLADEGVTAGVHHVGDVMYDVALQMAASKKPVPAAFEELPAKGFVLATIHRAENTDEPARLNAILQALATLARRRPVVLPLHPRTRAVIAQHGLRTDSLKVLAPVGMFEMSWLERKAALVISDSGGVQKEAYFHRTPCVTVRTETEWVETVTSGWNRLADPSRTEEIVERAEAALSQPNPTTTIPEYGNGQAAEALVERLSLSL